MECAKTLILLKRKLPFMEKYSRSYQVSFATECRRREGGHLKVHKIIYVLGALSWKKTIIYLLKKIIIIQVV